MSWKQSDRKDHCKSIKLDDVIWSEPFRKTLEFVSLSKSAPLLKPDDHEELSMMRK